MQFLLVRLLGLIKCQLESLKTACRLYSLLLPQSSMLLFHLQHSQGSGKQPKSHLDTPIPKQGNHELPNNNRPISLLPVLSKVCERVAYNQFVTSVFDNKEEADDKAKWKQKMALY